MNSNKIIFRKKMYDILSGDGVNVRWLFNNVVHLSHNDICRLSYVVVDDFKFKGCVSSNVKFIDDCLSRSEDFLIDMSLFSERLGIIDNMVKMRNVCLNKTAIKKISSIPIIKLCSKVGISQNDFRQMGYAKINKDGTLSPVTKAKTITVMNMCKAIKCRPADILIDLSKINVNDNN